MTAVDNKAPIPDIQLDTSPTPEVGSRWHRFGAALTAALAPLTMHDTVAQAAPYGPDITAPQVDTATYSPGTWHGGVPRAQAENSQKVDYEAAPPILEGNRFIPSLEDGVNKLEAAMPSDAKIAEGYSQGALVVGMWARQHGIDHPDLQLLLEGNPCRPLQADGQNGGLLEANPWLNVLLGSDLCGDGTTGGRPSTDICVDGDPICDAPKLEGRPIDEVIIELSDMLAGYFDRHNKYSEPFTPQQATEYAQGNTTLVDVKISQNEPLIDLLEEKLQGPLPTFIKDYLNSRIREKSTPADAQPTEFNLVTPSLNVEEPYTPAAAEVIADQAPQWKIDLDTNTASFVDTTTANANQFIQDTGNTIQQTTGIDTAPVVAAGQRLVEDVQYGILGIVGAPPPAN